MRTNTSGPAPTAASAPKGTAKNIAGAMPGAPNPTGCRHPRPSHPTRRPLASRYDAGPNRFGDCRFGSTHRGLDPLEDQFVTGSKLRVRWWCGPGLAGLGAFDDPLNGLVGGVAISAAPRLGSDPAVAGKMLPFSRYNMELLGRCGDC